MDNVSVAAMASDSLDATMFNAKTPGEKHETERLQVATRASYRKYRHHCKYPVYNTKPRSPTVGSGTTRHGARHAVAAGHDKAERRERRSARY